MVPKVFEPLKFNCSGFDWNNKALIKVIVLDKKFFVFNPNVLIFFLFLHKNLCYGYSLETPRQGAQLWTKICEIRQNFKGDLTKFCEIFINIILQPSQSSLKSFFYHVRSL